MANAFSTVFLVAGIYAIIDTSSLFWQVCFIWKKKKSLVPMANAFSIVCLVTGIYAIFDTSSLFWQVYFIWKKK